MPSVWKKSIAKIVGTYGETTNNSKNEVKELLFKKYLIHLQRLNKFPKTSLWTQIISSLESHFPSIVKESLNLINVKEYFNNYWHKDHAFTSHK